MVTATPKPTEVHDASALEKALSPPANPASTSPGLSNFSTARNSTTSPLDETKSSHRYLNEEQALDWCRKYPGSEEEIYITYSQDDKDNPRNWGLYRKWYITCLVSMANVLTCLCAGGWSSGATYFAEEFGVSAEVATLGLAMYVLGFAFGPLLLAPLSEYYGRSPVYFVGWGLLVIFQIPVALAPNIGTVIVCRFIGGFFGAAPLTNTGGTVSDLWSRNTSGPAMAVYGVSSTSGPPLALVITGYIALHLGWRDNIWIIMGILGAFWLLMIATLPETRHTIILDRKAKRLRKTLQKEGVGNGEKIRDANADEKKGLSTLFKITLSRPFVFLFTEPITYASAIYNGFIYGLVYIFNEAFPLVFGDGHGFNTGEVGLSFLGLTIGPVIGACLHFLQERYYLKRVAQNHGKGVPEARMWMGLVGAVMLPVSLFWFAWTSYPSVHWISPILASALFGLGIYIIILGILNYVVDAYQTYSASALAGVIFVRNLVGGGFPMFATYMYNRLGWEWASSLLAFLSILLIPIPFIFFFRGEAIRLKSPWAREHFEQDDDKPH